MLVEKAHLSLFFYSFVEDKLSSLFKDSFFPNRRSLSASIGQDFWPDPKCIGRSEFLWAASPNVQPLPQEHHGSVEPCACQEWWGWVSCPVPCPNWSVHLTSQLTLDILYLYDAHQTFTGECDCTYLTLLEYFRAAPRSARPPTYVWYGHPPCPTWLPLFCSPVTATTL